MFKFVQLALYFYNTFRIVAGLPSEDLLLIIQSVSDRKLKATDKSISKKNLL